MKRLILVLAFLYTTLYACAFRYRLDDYIPELDDPIEAIFWGIVLLVVGTIALLLFIFGLKDLFKLLIRLIIIVFRKKYYLSPDTELFHSINEAKNYKERGDECFDSYFWSESRRCRLLSFGFEIVKVEVYDEEDVESYGGIREEPKRYYVFTKKLKSSKK